MYNNYEDKYSGQTDSAVLLLVCSLYFNFYEYRYLTQGTLKVQQYNITADFMTFYILWEHNIYTNLLWIYAYLLNNQYICWLYIYVISSNGSGII